jgi:hypothetical protein
MYWWIRDPGDGGQLRFKSNTSPQSNPVGPRLHTWSRHEWVHVAFSHDAAAKRGAAYLNGQEKIAGSWSLPTGNFATYRTGIGVVNCADGLGTFNGALGEVMIFQRPLTAAEVQDAMDGFDEPVATQPNPADGKTYVPADVTLGWTSNGVSPMHNVYLGTSFDGLARVAQGLTETTFQPAEPLEYGTTHFWRIDEVNGARTTRCSQATSGSSPPSRSPIRSRASPPRPVPTPRAWARRKPSTAPA